MREQIATLNLLVDRRTTVGELKHVAYSKPPIRLAGLGECLGVCQEPKPIHEAEVRLRLERFPREVEVQTLLRICVRVRHPLSRLPLRVAAVKPNVQRRQSLLAIKDRDHALPGRNLYRRRIRVILLVVVGEEVVETERRGELGTNIPEEKRPDGIAAKEAVEQRADLIGGPHEFALNRREYIRAIMDLV